LNRNRWPTFTGICTQAQIVSRLSGWPQNRPANLNEITYLLKTYNFNAWSVTYPANYEQLYNTLLTGWKLIAFVNPSDNPQIGHFIILQSISNNGFVVVSDPSTGMTYEQRIEQLYYTWKWGGSVVVGTPH
jgi:ABC-type bacteriocin/lantibiotic exporter with double-glycine peptidase domain